MGDDRRTSRVASADDIVQIARLLHDFNTEFDVASPGVERLAERLARLLAGDETMAIVAGRPAVAVALITFRENVWYDGRVALLDELYVVPPLRSKGIGSALVEHLLTTAPTAGVDLIEINVDEGDVDARRFYERHGFSATEPDTGERALYYHLEFPGSARVTARTARDDGLPARTFGWSDMWAAADDDPRADGGFANDERSMLTGFVADRRLTLPMKCAGLDAEAMARRSVPPSDLSLLGLVRHLAGVERYWFRRVIAGEDVDQPYRDETGADVEFEVALDPEMVEAAWAIWRGEVAAAEAIVAQVADLGELGKGEPVPVREVLVHVIREYAQHLGHADLLRERIDGRVGQ